MATKKFDEDEDSFYSEDKVYFVDDAFLIWNEVKEKIENGELEDGHDVMVYEYTETKSIKVTQKVELE